MISSLILELARPRWIVLPLLAQRRKSRTPAPDKTREVAFITAARPLTKKMIDWASSDVDKLFQLADKQLGRISAAMKSSAVEKSASYARLARDMSVKSGLRVRGNIGLFIGRGGANIRSLERQSGCLVYSNRESNTWFVFYPDDASLNIVKRRMGY